MHPDTTPGAGPVYVADGWGLKIHVERGHLIVHDGIGRDRRTARFHRITSGIKRLVVIGHSGYVTLEALRWLVGIKAAFVQLDRDGNLITISAPERLSEVRLRRAQVLAAENDQGRRAVAELLKTKLARQAAIAERLAPLRPTGESKPSRPRHAGPGDAGDRVDSRPLLLADVGSCPGQLPSLLGEVGSGALAPGRVANLGR
jgi:CRISPR associated protein Cas1